MTYDKIDQPFKALSEKEIGATKAFIAELQTDIMKSQQPTSSGFSGKALFLPDLEIKDGTTVANDFIDASSIASINGKDVRLSKPERDPNQSVKEGKKTTPSTDQEAESSRSRLKPQTIKSLELQRILDDLRQKGVKFGTLPPPIKEQNTLPIPKGLREDTKGNSLQQ